MNRVLCLATGRSRSSRCVVLAFIVVVAGLMDVVVDEATAGTSNGEQSFLCTDCGRSA